MAQLKFPDLEPGPLRELFLALHELHALAGAPPIREIAEAVGCSRHKIHQLFTSGRLPADGNTLYDVAGWLASQGRRPRFTSDDGEGDNAREEEFYAWLEEKWRAAQRYVAYPPPIGGAGSQTPRPREAVVSPPPTSTAEPPGSDDDTPAIRQEARAAGEGQIYQAGRDAYTAARDVVVHPRPTRDRTVISARERSEEWRKILPDPATSHALLVGMEHYRSDEIPDLYGVAPGLKRLGRVLTDPHREGSFPASNTIQLLNPPSSTEVLTQLHQAADRATDTLLLHISGHGNVTSRGTLTFPTTDSDLSLPFTHLSWEDIRDQLSQARARRSLVIVDACYSGRALDTMGPLDPAFDAPVSYQLTSTGPQHASFDGPEGSEFTSALIDLLTKGDPHAGDLLTIEEIHRSLYNRARREQFPEPRFNGARQHNALALGRNPAASQRTERTL
ncbi:caspase family protein [Actinomadura sp. NPDC023710]|uniref:caspase family protein n=1 Tax=Actinomadura sp. NPDC023710 TaxID=3158219 RepID=UPI0033EABA61